MLYKRIMSGLVGLASCCVVSTVQAEEANGSVLTKVSTQGLGVELSGSAYDGISVRVGFNYFDYGREFDSDDITYDADLTLKSVNFLVDWYPFESGFRITGGGVWDMNKLTGTALASDNYSIGSRDYTQDQVGILTGQVDFRDISPYAGIGFGRTVSKESGWGFIADFGVVFTGSPRVNLVSSGGILSDHPILLADLQSEADSVSDDIKVFKFYPVIALAVTYSF